VREFYVGIERPHLIYQCRIKDATDVYTNIEAEYKEVGGFFMPKRWVYTDRSGGPKAFFQSEYGVETFQVNEELTEAMFEKSLEPGMAVLHVPENKDYTVRPDGTLGPYLAGDADRRRFMWIVMALLLGACVVFVVVRFIQRNRKSKNS
jgi:hypothetical protein